MLSPVVNGANRTYGCREAYCLVHWHGRSTSLAHGRADGLPFDREARLRIVVVARVLQRALPAWPSETNADGARLLNVGPIPKPTAARSRRAGTLRRGPGGIRPQVSCRLRLIVGIRCRGIHSVLPLSGNHIIIPARCGVVLNAEQWFVKNPELVQKEGTRPARCNGEADKEVEKDARCDRRSRFGAQRIACGAALLRLRASGRPIILH